MIVYIFLKDNRNVSDVLVKHYMLNINTKAIVGVRAARAIVGGMGRLRGLGQVGLVGRVGQVRGVKM